MEPTKENIESLNNHNQSIIDEIDGSAKKPADNGIEFYDDMMKRHMQFQRDMHDQQNRFALQDLEIQKRYDAYFKEKR